MADDSEAVQAALTKIVDFDTQSARLKRWVNEHDMLLGREPRFPNVSEAALSTAEALRAPRKAFPPGAFFNKPFAAAARTIMETRFESAGNQPNPASVDEIHDALLQGSFAFEPTQIDAQKNSIRISLGKNSTTFVKLPGTDLFGLVEWYGRRTTRSRPRVGPALAEGIDDEPANENPAPVAAASDDTPMRR